MWKYTQKKIFNRHEWSNIAEDYKKLLKKIKELKLYIVKFNGNNEIKPKFYLLDCVIRVDRANNYGVY